MSKLILRDVWKFVRPSGVRGVGLVGGSSLERAERFAVAIWFNPHPYKTYHVQSFFRGEVVDPSNPYRPQAGKLRIAIGKPESFNSLGMARTRAKQMVLVHSGKILWEDVTFQHVDHDKPIPCWFKSTT